MRIRVLHFMSGGEIGGKERSQYQLFNVFKDDPEYDLGAAFSNDNGFYISKVRQLGIPVIDLKIKSGFNYIYKGKILSEFRKFDIHHLHDPAPNILIYSLLAGKGVKRVFTRRGGMIDFAFLPLRKKMKYLLNRALLKRCDGYSGNSINAVRSLVDQYGIAADRVRLLYNGVDADTLRANTTREDARKGLGLIPGDFAVGTACHLIRCKRVDLLLRSFAMSRIPHKKFFIFGKGPLEGELRRSAAELQIGEQVVFAGEVTPIADRLIALDCFVLASNNEESFGNAVVEAMSLKVPVIIMADGGGLREHVSDGRTGRVARDENDLALKLELVASDPAESLRLAGQAALEINDKYSMTRMVREYKKFYREVLHG